ncbi:aminotransferase class I/II-fold pyridoxal phosphate-dependent enzyme, partial [Candidatus Bipolaricaulota bacterium]|nr:aminotransferase class I/II-fold pyridoxal phosphate-dependent enzyme [Candidatus Bipolaricaulota bacterium]
MGKYDFIVQELAALKEQGLYNIIRTLESPVGAWTVVDGRRVLNMCSNNYLGFANDPRLKEAALKAIEEYGVGPAAVRSIAGTMSLHHELERKLAEFKHTEDAVSFQSGFCANLATIPALMGKDGVIFTDELNHASIIDGCRLTKAQRVIFPHRDADALAKALEEHKD